jgi:hypothetical protein
VALRATREAELAIDGNVIIASSKVDGSPARATVSLALGPHAVFLSGVIRCPEDAIPVTCVLSGEAPAPVPAENLFPRWIGGLAGEVWASSNPEPWTTTPVQRRVDPVLGLLELRGEPAFGDRPLQARWRGQLTIGEGGVYRFSTRSTARVALTVAGRTVLSAAPGQASGELEITAGRHRIELVCNWPPGRAAVELYWTPPRGHREIIPPAVLSPDWNAKRAARRTRGAD